MRDRPQPWSRPDLLRAHLARMLAPVPEAAAGLHAGDDGHDRIVATGAIRPAAVLVGLVERDTGPRLLLTTRASHLRDHAGQVSFPGGRMEAWDASPAAAALREAQEEVGLPIDHVEVLGALPSYVTVTGFEIQPVVGWVTPPERWTLDPFEVADVFEMPLSFALDLANHRRESRERDGRQRSYWVLPWEDRYVWGATAGIIVNFVNILRRP